MPRKKKSQSNNAESKAKSLKDLELQNEVIYNKKHTIASDGSIVNRAEQIKYSDSQG